MVPALAGLATLAMLGAGQVVQRGVGDQGATDAARAQQAYGDLPLAFEANRGQTDPEVDFLARGRGYSLFLTSGGMVASLTPVLGDGAGPAAAGEPEPTIVRMNLVGSDPTARSSGRSQLPGVVNHLVGADPAHWRTGIPTFGQVAYQGVYPGIDMVYYGDRGGIEYDFVVAPGADPSTIGLAFEGADRVSVASDGALVVDTGAGSLRHAAPVVFQQVGETRRPVPGAFVVGAGGRVGFEVGAYDRTLPLVIDPYFEYGTFLGGSANDFGWGLAVDGQGRAHLGGETSSSVFPRSNDVPPGPSKAVGQGTDAFVLRMSADGTALDFVTFFGGTAADSGADLALDGDGNAYLTGSTASANLPTSAGAYDTSCGSDGSCDGTADHFLARFDTSGAIVYSTFLGGSGVEQHAPGTPYSGAAGLAVRGSTAYLHSNTFSEDFPLTANAFQTACRSCADGTSDGYLSLIDTSKTGAAGLVYSSYLGGDGDEQSKGVAVDARGRAYVTGITVSTAVDRKGDPTGKNSFPVKSALQEKYRGGYSDAYVAKFDPFASKRAQTLVYSTFLGGGGLEEGWDIAVRGELAYVTGYTTSGPDPNAAFANPADPAADPAPYFPTTPGAYDTSYGGRASTDSGSTLFLDGDAFVAVLNAKGSGLVWSTFLGGPSADYGQSIALDPTGQVYVTGWTTCRQQDNRATTANETPPQFVLFDHDSNPSTPDVPVPTGRGPGDPDSTGVGDCDGQNPHGTSSPPAGVFPQVDPVVDPGRGLDESAMDSTYLGFELHNSPTGIFVTKLAADGSAVDYSVLLDGNGFDRGFAVAVRATDAGGSPITPEAYVTGRTGRQAGFPIQTNSPMPYDDTYNGAGRDAFLIKLVG